MPFEAPTIHLREPTMIAASWRELFFVVWRSPGGAESVRAVVAQELALVRRLRGRKIAIFTVVSSSIRMPDAPTREAVNAARRDLDSVTKAELVVLTTSGFVTATIRSIIAGVTLLRPPAYPVTTLNSLDAAFAWMAPHLDPDEGHPIAPATLAAAYAVLGAPSARSA